MRKSVQSNLAIAISSIVFSISCGTKTVPTSESSSHNTVAESAFGSQSFYGPVADKLLKGMSSYRDAIRTSNGYMLRGINTSIECRFDGLCTITGPALRNGQLNIDLGSQTIPFNSPSKPIQRQLFEVVKLVADGGVASSGFSTQWICEFVHPTNHNCLKQGDELSAGISFDQFNPGPHTYSAILKLVPAI